MKDYDLQYVQKFLKENYLDIGKRFVKFDLANPEIYAWMKKYVEPLNDGTFPIPRMVYHVMHGLDGPACNNETCTNRAKWNKVVYNEYCSVKCSNSSKKKKDAINKTLVKNYGNTLGKNKEIHKKIKNSMQERYGVNSSFESKELMDKAKETIKERYGVEHVSQAEEIKEKTRKTNLEKYGVEYGLQSEEIKSKGRKTNLETYGVTHPMKSELVKSKVKATMTERYGVEHFHHLLLENDVIEYLNDKDYLIKEHHENKKNCTEISNDLNVDVTTVIRAIKRYDIEQRYYAQRSKYEDEIEDFLISNNINYVKNDRSSIAPYEIDFNLIDYNIGIEFCGLYWHCEHYKGKKYHKMKHDMCKSENIQLLTIFEDEWIENQKLIRKMILHKLNMSSSEKTYARKCKVIQCNKEQEKTFLNSNHIQGQGNSSICYGLEYDGNIVAVMSFKKHKRGYELNRFCTSQIVVGGFSKLLKHFRLNHKGCIVSYVDLRWGNGKTYELSGFIKEKELAPDYSYINRDKRFHKFNFRKKYLKNRLKIYDSQLSERENCEINGIHRIYDCGKVRYVYL